MSADRDQLEALARDVLESLDGASPAAVRLLASGLRLAGLSELAGPFYLYATDREEEGVPGEITVLCMSRTLRVLTCRTELLERLEGVDEPPWPALAGALERARETEAA